MAAVDIERDAVDGYDVVKALRQPDQSDVVVGRNGRRGLRGRPEGQSTCSHASVRTSPSIPVISSNSA